MNSKQKPKIEKNSNIEQQQKSRNISVRQLHTKKNVEKKRFFFKNEE